MGVNQSYFNKYTDPMQKEIDRVNVYELESGMDYELTTLGGEINPENIKKAQAKVLKNLRQDPAYYTNRLASDSVKLVGEWGSGKKPGTRNTAKSAEAVKAEVKTPKDDALTKDKANEMKVAKKDVKANVRKDSKVKNPNNPGKVATMTQTPKKARGAKVMAMPGKEKKITLKEGVDVYNMLSNLGIDQAEINDIVQSIKAALPPTLKTLPFSALMAFLANREKNNGLEENFSGPDTSLGERLRKNAPISKYVSDFEKSKAPQFKGKTAKEKRNMAVAAHAQKNPKNPMGEAYDTHNTPTPSMLIHMDMDRFKSVMSKMDAFDKRTLKNKLENAETSIKNALQDKLKQANIMLENVQVKDSRTIRLTPENVKAIKSMIKEMIMKKGTDTVVASKPNTINTLKTSGYTPIQGTEDAK
jgi:hypothetical protein